MRSSIIRRVIMMLLPLTFSSMAIAQNDFQRIFDEFKKANEKEFADFRDKANAEYAEFLRKSWEWFEGKAPIPRPEHKEPVVPPVVAPEEDQDHELEDRELVIEDIVPEADPVPAPQPIAPITEVPVPVAKYLAFSIYGTSCSVRYDSSDKPFLKDSEPNSVAGYWEELGGSEAMDNLLYDCISLRDRMSLCDWAFYKMTESMSRTIYPYSQDEASVFQAFVLSQAGFRLRIGYSADDEHLHFLMAAECDMYGYPYWELDSGHYYLLDGSDVDNMRLVTTDFPESRPMRLTIDDDNLFAENLSQSRTLVSERYSDVTATVRTNLNLIAFYDEYPQSVVNNDSRTRWRFYANAPAGRNVRETLYPQLNKSISGKSEIEAVEILLNFVQTSLVYEYDDKIWGTDRSFFPDESLYYPYCDCEDRSILFSRLVRDLLGLDVALIYYPGHLAAAVKFTQPVNGDYVSVSGARYTICDPTYINAPVGLTMPDMDNSSAFVILL